MKTLSLWVIILLSLSASATILQVQSAAKWSCSGTSCAQPFTLQPPAYHNLVVVWTFWQSTSTFTALAADNLLCQGNPCNTYLSAVGPTLQSSASTPTSAQIFYAKNFYNLNNLPVTVTVNFSGSVTSAGVVIVEYSGADPNYPLDSVSEAISNSTSPSNALDSGTASPANASLLVFGAGVVDNASGLVPGSGFTSVQSSTIGTAASAITEQNASAINTNTLLQRATACLGGGLTCSSATGDWLMQMAIFRAASWTVAGR